MEEYVDDSKRNEFARMAWVIEFPSSSQARNWLLENEYSMLENINSADFTPGVKPLPTASPSA